MRRNTGKNHGACKQCRDESFGLCLTEDVPPHCRPPGTPETAADGEMGSVSHDMIGR